MFFGQTFIPNRKQKCYIGAEGVADESCVVWFVKIQYTFYTLLKILLSFIKILFLVFLFFLV